MSAPSNNNSLGRKVKTWEIRISQMMGELSSIWTLLQITILKDKAVIVPEATNRLSPHGVCVWDLHQISLPRSLIGICTMRTRRRTC